VLDQLRVRVTLQTGNRERKAWVGQDHWVWTVLDSVAELDLSAFYAAYRVDGRARPAYDPAMMA
jgi:hypothetical protein